MDFLMDSAYFVTVLILILLAVLGFVNDGW